MYKFSVVFGNVFLWICNFTCLPGHGWHAADEGHDGGYGDSPVSFEGGDSSGYSLSGTGAEYGSDDGHSGY